MRIDKLYLKNFWGIREETLEFPQALERPAGGNGSFNLLVGPNGAGKTSVLEGLAVAASGLFVRIPGADVRHIKHDDAHIIIKRIEGRAQREPQYPVKVTGWGMLDGDALEWTRSLDTPSGRTSHRDAKEMMSASRAMAVRANERWQDSLPLVSYYSADRLWNEPRDMKRKRKEDLKKRAPHEMSSAPKNEAEEAWEQFGQRVGGYSNSVNGRCSPRDLQRWLGFEDYKAYREKNESAHAQIVKQAMLESLPGIDDLSYDGGLGTLLFLHNDNWLEFAHLSEGQRNMAALVGDIAWKAAQLNPHLGQNALRQTQGVVLIDELGLHLHPEWQRMIVQKLQEIFPELQFIAATHSPQIIGEVQAEEILLLTDDGPRAPAFSFGMDSNWVVETVMGGSRCNPKVKEELDTIFKLIEERDLDEAEKKATLLRGEVGNSDDIQRTISMIERIKLLGK